MVNVRRAISQIIGGIQCVLGVLASILVFIIYASPLMRETLSITTEGEVYLYMFLFSIFGVFSILSGLLTIREET